MPKRIVVEHAGLSWIIGVCDDPPVVIEGLNAMPFVSLVRVTERAAFYRAPMVPSAANVKTFDPRQQ